MALTIFSDGSAGAARGALEAADELGLKVGGWTAATGLPAVYTDRLRATLAPRMAARLNVQDSDGTLILSFAPGLTAGSPAAYADEAVEQQRKASLHIVLPEGGRSSIPEDVRKGVLAWIAEERIATLHVTGPREADEPGIGQAVRDALVWIFEDEVSGTVAPGEPAAPMPEVSTPAGPSADASLQAVPPATLPQADRTPETEIVRLAAEIAAMPSPTHIAINPANVDAAIEAGLDVVEAPPGAALLHPVGPGTLFKSGKWLGDSGCGYWLPDGSTCGKFGAAMNGRIGWRCREHLIGSPEGPDVLGAPMDPPTDPRYSREHSDAEALAFDPPPPVPPEVWAARDRLLADVPGVGLDDGAFTVSREDHYRKLRLEFPPGLDPDIVPEPTDSEAPAATHGPYSMPPPGGWKVDGPVSPPVPDVVTEHPGYNGIGRFVEPPALGQPWTRDNWLWCGCAGPHGQCPNERCTNHRDAPYP